MHPSLKLLSITAVAGLGLMAAAFTSPKLSVSTRRA